MDPNETLRVIRECVNVIQGIRDAEDAVDRARLDDLLGSDDAQDVTDRLVEHVQALDEWLSKGGFPPSAWRRERRNPLIK